MLTITETLDAGDKLQELLAQRHKQRLLTSQERAAVQAFLDRLQRAYGRAVQLTMLFGSKARGDNGPGSDIDILMSVAEKCWPLRDAISTIAARVSLEYGVLIAPRVIGWERWQQC